MILSCTRQLRLGLQRLDSGTRVWEGGATGTEILWTRVQDQEV